MKRMLAFTGRKRLGSGYLRGDGERAGLGLRSRMPVDGGSSDTPMDTLESLRFANGFRNTDESIERADGFGAAGAASATGANETARLASCSPLETVCEALEAPVITMP
jgi:hypothetical protein